jgi:hypothetical protein
MYKKMQKGKISNEDYEKALVGRATLSNREDDAKEDDKDLDEEAQRFKKHKKTQERLLQRTGQGERTSRAQDGRAKERSAAT